MLSEHVSNSKASRKVIFEAHDIMINLPMIRCQRPISRCLPFSCCMVGVWSTTVLELVSVALLWSLASALISFLFFHRRIEGNEISSSDCDTNTNAALWWNRTISFVNGLNRWMQSQKDTWLQRHRSYKTHQMNGRSLWERWKMDRLWTRHRPITVLVRHWHMMLRSCEVDLLLVLSHAIKQDKTEMSHPC